MRLERRHPAGWRGGILPPSTGRRLEAAGPGAWKAALHQIRDAPSGSCAEAQGTDDHGETAGEVGGNADDHGPLMDAMP
jgi:hypothetical protein